MVQLHLFAEGETEQTFADTVLKPHLANLGVYMQKPTLIAHARKKGIVHRGGGRNFRAMQNDIDRRRKQESGNIDDGQHTAPSKRIIAEFPEYSKTTVGSQMAERIGLENIRSKCPHFKAWVERLEKLGAPKRP